MIANLDSGLDALDKKATSVSRHKIQNVAHAYAWWAAKGCISLAVLKVRKVSTALELTYH